MSTNRTDPPSPVALGLRERSKLRRRAHIQHTAMRMFAEHGYDRTTVADIAAAAEVAPRTVSGYFPTKLELAAGFADDVAGALSAACSAGDDIDVLQVLEAWLTGLAEEIDPDMIDVARAMYEANPGLGALQSATLATATESMRAAIAARLGLPVDHLVVGITRAAVAATLTEYLNRVGLRGDEVARREVLDFLRRLLEPPAPVGS